MTKVRIMLAAAAAALLLTGAACRSGDGGAKVATIDNGSDDSTSSDGSDGGNGGDGEATEQDFQDAMLEHAQCMRDHGIDMPDPTFDGSGEGGMVIARGAEGVDFESQQFKDAQKACEHIMDEVRQSMPQPSPEEQAEMQDEMLEFAQCMRDHGIDMPDPTFDGEGRVTIGVGGGPPLDSSDTSDAGSDAPNGGEGPRMDPAFEAAMEECGGEDGPFKMNVDESDRSDDSDGSDG